MWQRHFSSIAQVGCVAASLDLEGLFFFVNISHQIAQTFYKITQKPEYPPDFVTEDLPMNK